MSLTLTEARLRVRQQMDLVDEDGSNSARYGDSEINSALASGLSRFLLKYAQHGDGKLHELVEVTASSTGTVDLSSYNPVEVLAASVLRQGMAFPAVRVDPIDRGRASETAHSLRLYLLRDWAIDTVNDYLVSDGTNQASTFRAQDDLICGYASEALVPKEESRRDNLRELNYKLEEAVFPLGGAEVTKHPSGRGTNDFAFYYDKGAQTLGVVFRSRGFYGVGL